MCIQMGHILYQLYMNSFLLGTTQYNIKYLQIKYIEITEDFFGITLALVIRTRGVNYDYS